MSSKKSATRRLSLVAGSSLVAASLNIFAFAGAALAPATVYAADECTPVPPTLGNGSGPVSDDPTLNGSTADSFNCSAATYATGITYSSAGDLTVGKTTTTVTSVTADGVNLTASGTDSVTWDSSAGGVTGSTATAGPLIDVTSVSGDITIITGAVTANQVGSTHGIRATSTGGGDITISRVAGAVNANVLGGQAGIEAVTNGGDISIVTAGAQTSGRLRGIFAQTSGAGAIDLNLSGGVLTNQADSVATVEARAGTGGLRILISSGNVSAGFVPHRTAIIAASAGGADVDVLGTVTGRVDFSGVSAGGVTFDTSGLGRWAADAASIFSSQDDSIGIGGVGQVSTLATGASIDLGAGADTLAVSSGLTAGAGTISFGAGADLLNVSGQFTANGSTVDFGAENDSLTVSGSLVADSASFDFGPGSDAVSLSGVLAANSLVLTNLESFSNGGAIHFGGSASATDGVADDVLRLQGVSYTGGDGRLVLDVNLGAGGQAGCEVLSGVADCLDLRGGSTAGQTFITLNNIGPSASQGGYDPVGVTLVDVGGGTSAQGDFVLDPDTDGVAENALYGQALGRPGLFFFSLQYDPETQRHNLVGLPRREVLDYAVLGSAAHSVWYMTSAAVTDRQTDLRAGTEGEMWLRASGEYDKRDMETSFATSGDPITVDNSYKQYSGSIIGGMDFFTGHTGGYDYVVGGQIGYVTSSLELTEAESSGRMSGGTGGLYAGAWTQRFFLDGAFNANVMTLDYDSPGIGSKTNTYLNSVGAQLEGGMRHMLTERTYLEPLVTAAFVNTTFEEISLFGGEVVPDKAQSRRAALGARLGADLTEGAINVSYFVAGRAWNEFDGESGVVINNPGTNLVLTDDFSGRFGEAQAGVNLYNDDGTLSGFLNSGVKFKEGYDAVTAALGLRMRW